MYTAHELWRAPASPLEIPPPPTAPPSFSYLDSGRQSKDPRDTNFLRLLNRKRESSHNSPADVPSAAGLRSSQPISPWKLGRTEYKSLYQVVGSPGRTGGFFRLHGTPLNAGAFGVVHRCTFIHKDGGCSEVAVKILRLDPASTSFNSSDNQKRLLRRLRREFQMWEQLQHSNIAPILGWAAEPNDVCLVSPWYDRGNLRHYLKYNETVNRLKLMHGLVLGLAYLHGRTEQIIHGDVSLENVLVGANDRAMLIDFGLSSYHELGIETSMGPHGNQRYLPIERVQAEGDQDDDAVVEQELPDNAQPGLMILTIDLLGPLLVFPSMVYFILLSMWQSRSTRPKETISPDPLIRQSSGDVWSFAYVAHHILTGDMPWHNLPVPNVYARLALGKTPKSTPDKTRVPELPADHIWWKELDRCWSPKPNARPTMAELDVLLISVRGTNEA